MKYNELELLPSLAKSYLDELAGLMRYMVEFRPELEDILDIDGLEALDAGFASDEWPLQDGKTSTDVLNVIVKNVFRTDDLVAIVSLFKMNDEGCFTKQDGKAICSILILAIPPIGFIRHLLNSHLITLFECIFLVGYFTDTTEIISHCVDIVEKDLVTGDIEPRDPSRLLKASDLPIICFDGTFNIPNLSWLLTFDEAEQWVTNKFGISLMGFRNEINKIHENHKKSDSSQKLNPAYLDKNHPMFSLELSIAIEAWEQVLSSEPNRPKVGSRKGLIEKWLKINHKGLSEAARRRITTIINPDKNGGVSASSE